MKRRFHWLPRAPSKTALVIILSVLALALWHVTTVGRRTTIHVFELSETPDSLTEALTIEMAENALRTDGVDPHEWGLLPARPLKPDGTFIDQMTTSRASLTFTNADLPPRRVIISLINNQSPLRYPLRRQVS